MPGGAETVKGTEKRTGPCAGRKVEDDAKLERFIQHFDAKQFRPIIKRIFDINPGESTDPASAWTGILGVLNRLSIPIRDRRFRRRIKAGVDRTNTKVIVAEGDSWFQYPFFVTDIVDHLLRDGRVVCSLAAGGDWIGNMVYEDKYISELTDYQPEVFLISGGGNDLVGGSRLATLIDRNPPLLFEADLTPEEARWKADIDAMGMDNGDEVPGLTRGEMIVRGTRYLNNDFRALLRVFKCMYLLTFIRIIRSGKFGGMRIITQGYDFAVPNNDRSLTGPPSHWFSNGQWLYYPLLRKGLLDSNIQRSVMSAYIHCFNEMLIEVGSKLNAEAINTGIQVWHIDNRGLLKDKDWADELHPHSYAFRWVADAYGLVIDGTLAAKAPGMAQSKVVRVAELKNMGVIRSKQR